MDCTTTSHIGHTFLKLENVLQAKRQSLQNVLKNLESNDLKECQDLMKQAKQVTKEFTDNVNDIETKLEERAKEFHKKIDEILEINKTLLKEMKTSSLAILHEQEKSLSEGLERVKQEIKECEHCLRCGDVESLLKYGRAEDTSKAILPKISHVVPPVLAQSQIGTVTMVNI